MTSSKRNADRDAAPNAPRSAIAIAFSAAWSGFRASICALVIRGGASAPRAAALRTMAEKLEPSGRPTTDAPPNDLFIRRTSVDKTESVARLIALTAVEARDVDAKLDGTYSACAPDPFRCTTVSEAHES